MGIARRVAAARHAGEEALPARKGGPLVRGASRPGARLRRVRERSPPGRPFSAEITTTEGHLFMVEDQRFAWVRPGRPRVRDRSAEGKTSPWPVTSRSTLEVSTTDTDGDWIMKLIDVYPGDAPDPVPNPQVVRMGGFQMLLAAERLRRSSGTSSSTPEPMVPARSRP